MAYFYRKERFFILFLILVFGFFSCGGGSKDDPKRDRGGGAGDAGEDRDNDGPSSGGGRPSKLVISADIEDRYRGAADFDLEDDSGPECSKNSDCMDICRRLISTSRRSRCERSSEKLVRALEDGVFSLLNISDVHDVPVSPSLFYRLFEIDRSLISKLIRQSRFSEGGLRGFLAWIAVNSEIAQVLKSQDKSRTVLKDAFKKLGALQNSGVSNRLRSGLNTGLIGENDTFLYLAASADNEEAFITGHAIVDKTLCRVGGGNIYACKMELYCARENRKDRRRSRLRYANQVRCRTPEEGRRAAPRASALRRYRPASICYVHGTLVWSYLYDLMEEREIRDAHLSRDLQIGVDSCKKTCGRTTRCDRVLESG